MLLRDLRVRLSLCIHITYSCCFGQKSNLIDDRFKSILEQLRKIFCVTTIAIDVRSYDPIYDKKFSEIE